MNDLRKAAEMALEALNYHFDNEDDDLNWGYPLVLEAKQALRQALAQPEQESAKLDCSAPFVMTPHRVFAKPPKREWIGLTDEEGAEIWGDAHDIDWKRLVTPKEIIKRIEAKLKEKNGG